MNKDLHLFGKTIPHEQLVPLIAVVLAVGMIFFVIFPQISSFGEERRRISQKQSDVARLNASLAALNNTSDGTIDQDYAVVEHALPAQKDIISIFSTVSLLAAESDLQIQGFVMKVGNYYATQGGETDASKIPASPTLDVTLKLSSENEDEVSEFINGVYTSLPLAKINSVAFLNNETTVEMAFYYQAIDLDAVKNSDDVKQYESENSRIIQNLRQWAQ